MYLEISTTLMDALRNDQVSAEARPGCIHAALLAAIGLAKATLRPNHKGIPMFSEVAENLVETINVAQSEV